MMTLARSSAQSAGEAAHISLILNVHNEIHFLQRTMKSINSAVSYARQFGLRFELVTVFDRSDNKTSALFEEFDKSDYSNYKSVFVDYGSLGLARQAGINVSAGDFVATCDADDLISYNMFADMYSAASRSAQKTIVIPEYVYEFGSKYGITRYFGSEYISPKLLFSSHPFVSRIFLRRSMFDFLKFEDVSGPIFAYEDWKFNCEALVNGCQFRVAPRTVLYYRRRRGSITGSIEDANQKLVPYCTFFSFKGFVDAIQSRSTLEFVKEDSAEIAHTDVVSGFASDPVLLDATWSAARIDPGVAIPEAESVVGTCLKLISYESGNYYESISRKLTGRKPAGLVALPDNLTSQDALCLAEVLPVLMRRDKIDDCVVFDLYHSDFNARIFGAIKGTYYISAGEGSSAIATDIHQHLFIRIIQNLPLNAPIILFASDVYLRILCKYGNVVANGHPISLVICGHDKFDQSIWRDDSTLFNLLSDCLHLVKNLITWDECLSDYLNDCFGRPNFENELIPGSSASYILNVGR
ncbi:Glycosyl transferase family 2 [Methylobacterium sp. 275MFSha3.1]|uniref:glycosyltransferase family 2 protein n=1 Tax=Methylobacterium sp. 275MFSha3.1 TaxID=1502746 RepID=UPI0008A7C755|nr:glycosyltransferase family A protein [Methylobacterium sp. 275MFSha3.1]SEI15154.1 Glycosyl transferase family 2 [Methylobacterium sp. 275MFSha3.1]